MRKSLTFRILCTLLALSIAGCGWKVVPPLRSEQPISQTRTAEQVMMTVNAGAVVWGGGQLGDIVRDTLLAEGTFKEIYYPVEPRNAPDLRLSIAARGSVDEEVGLGIVKSIIIGALLFIPVGLIRFNKTYDLDAEVTLLKAGKELQRLTIKSSTEISHTMFSQTEGYEPAARQAAFKDLGDQIAAKLSVLKAD